MMLTIELDRDDLAVDDPRLLDIMAKAMNAVHENELGVKQVTWAIVGRR